MKINLLLLAMLTCLVLNAQVNKGALFIGGDIQISGSKYKGTDPNNTLPAKTVNYYFSPVLGWAVKDNLVVGGRLMASYFDHDQTPYTSNNKGNSFGAGIWVRKYYSLANNFYFFADAGLNGQSTYRKQTALMTPGYYYKEKGFSLNATVYPGLAYKATKSLFVEAALNELVLLTYGHINTEQQNPGGTNTKGLNNNYSLSTSLGNGIPLQIGVRWIIAKR